MPRRSAGLLLYRQASSGLEILLVHPGGPFWANRDDGAWSIPKGEYLDGDDPHETAIREFTEELGSPPPDGPERNLGEVQQPGGKLVVAWAREGDLDAGAIVSNTFEMEWPRGSSRQQAFPEVDRAEWFAIDQARTKILGGQRPLLDRLAAQLEAP